MLVVMKRNCEICKVESEKQGECVIKMCKALDRKKGYLEGGYEICEVLFDGERLVAGDYYCREQVLKYKDGRTIVFRIGMIYRKEN